MLRYQGLVTAKLIGGVQNYAWGSHTALAQLRGEVTPTAKPEAELWLGTHPSLPSQLVTNSGLKPIQEPLPFLFKILAAAQPLSIQTHPNQAQAKAGFAREDDLHVAITAPNRNYKDDNHKPELICALSEFEALCGFRTAVDAHALFTRLAIPRFAHIIEPLLHGDLRVVFARLLSASLDERSAWVTSAAASAASLAEEPAYRWVAELARLYPADSGVLISLLLNYVKLQPGEALYLPAGNLHAYLQGTGVEVMATSDNVLRGGLTPKHVDIPELLSVTQVVPLAPPLLRPSSNAEGVATYESPFAEFRLSALHKTSKHPVKGPAIVWCERGEVVIFSPHGNLTIERCEAAYVSPDEQVTVSASDVAFVCVVPPG